MKTNITITIDQEIAKKLREETNFSDLINEQMKGYYDVKKSENIEFLSKELIKTKQILKKNRKKRRDIEETIEKITQKQKNFKKKLLSKAKMIEQIRTRRANERNPQKRVEYFITPEQEYDILLKGGKI